MAFSQQYIGAEMFNVSHSVGAGGANFWTDIMLVQTFIYAIYSYNYGTPSCYAISQKELYSLPNPNRDFKDLKKTETWIRRFQRDTAKSIGKAIVQDGRVDRLTGGFTPHGHVYTIATLNDSYETAITSTFGIENWQDDFLNDGDYPALMRGEILMSRRASVAAMR